MFMFKVSNLGSLEKSEEKNKGNNRVWTIFFIFTISFMYMFMFTVDVGPHWESLLFIDGSFDMSTTSVLHEIFRVGSERGTASHGPVNNLYYQTLFALFKYNFFFWRAVKSLFFAGVISLFYLICLRFLKKGYALAASIFTLFSFPLFIQVLVFDEGFIIGEFFKMVAIYLFLRDIENVKSSLQAQFFIFLAVLFAIRTYTPTYTLMGMMICYLIFICRDKLKRYIILLIALGLAAVPLHWTTLQFSDPAYGPKLTLISKFLLRDALQYIFSPLPALTDLYYLPLVAVLTFFIFWLFVFFIILGIFRLKEISSQKKKFFVFLFIWMMGETTILFVLPEHAIRYTAALMIPLIGIFCLLFEEIGQFFTKHARFLHYFFILCFILAVVTNLFYATLFRATWGSAFIGMNKVSNFILMEDLENSKKAELYYYATSAAPEYFTVDTTNKERYTVSDRIIPTVMRTDVFSNAYLQERVSDKKSAYVVKRISSFKNSVYPDIDLDDTNAFPSLKLLTTIEGRGNGLFDKVISFLVNIFQIPYQPNLFYIYKVVEVK